MENRITRNTQSLQEKFGKIYQKFFSENDLIVGGCFNLAWSPVGIGDHTSLSYIKQKIPTKCYVGFSKRSDNKIVFNNVLTLDLPNNGFQKHNFEDINDQYNDIINIIKNFIKDSESIEGYNISILAENMRGHGMGFSGNLSALISFGLHILLGKIELSNLKDYKNFCNTDAFTKIHKLAWKIDYISRYKKSSGENSMFTLLNTCDPIFYMGEVLDDNVTYEELDDKNNKFFDVLCEHNNKFELKSLLDYAIIFSGLESKTIQTEYYRNLDNKMEETLIFSLKELFVDNMKEYGINKIFENGTIKQTYTNIINILNLKLLYFFRKIFNDGFDESNLEKLIQNINSYRKAISLSENQTNFAEDFLYLFKKYKINLNENVGIMPVYSGKIGGGYLILMKYKHSRDTINKILSEFKNLGYKNVDLEYASWIDGTCGDGVQIEQYISKEIFSKYVKKGEVFYKDNLGKIYLGNYADIIEKEDGLIVDTIDKKIYIDGKKLTSKELHSQVTTVDVLQILLENIGEDVLNNKFPLSTYSKNKNEMLGKIILPLISLLKRRYGEELPLQCKGSLGEYYLKLSETNIKIGMIKKV